MHANTQWLIQTRLRCVNWPSRCLWFLESTYLSSALTPHSLSLGWNWHLWRSRQWFWKSEKEIHWAVFFFKSTIKWKNPKYIRGYQSSANLSHLTPQKFTSHWCKICCRSRQLSRVLVLQVLSHHSRPFQSYSSSLETYVSMITMAGSVLHWTLIVPKEGIYISSSYNQNQSHVPSLL